MFRVAKQFFYEMTMNDKGKRAHVLNNSHGRYVFGAFDKIWHRGSIWNGTRAVFLLSYTNQYFNHFVHHIKTFMTNI